MKPPWGLSACRCARFDWQGLSLCCQAFPHIGNCWRPSAEATSHPWTAAKQRAEWREYRSIGTSPHWQNGHSFGTRGAFTWKEEGWGVGICSGLCVSYNLQLFICLQTCTLSKSRHPLQQNKLVHTSGMYPSSTVQNVVQKELLHIGGVHSCRVGSLFRPGGKTFPPIISCRETMWRENALTEKKKVSFLYDQS